jgi:hypothetical protein
MTDVLIVSGPRGVGKTAVAFECMDILERTDLPAAMVDAELAYFHPRSANDPYGYAVAEEGLRVLWRVYAAQGIGRLVLPRVVEDEEQLAIVERAVPDAHIRLIRLVAGPDTIRERLSQRESGSALDWHVRRAADVARATLGEPVDAERPVAEIARDVLERAGWLRDEEAIPEDSPGK